MQIHTIQSPTFGLALLTVAGLAYAASLNSVDRQFMITAAKTDMTEAHEGEMAESQAKGADVKGFAEKIVKDDTEAYGHLIELAGKTGVSIPRGIDAAKDQTIQVLVHLKGGSFDRQFARDEIDANRRALAAFKMEAAHGHDPDVKAYAAKMIPILERDLHLAEDCAKAAARS